MAVAGVIKFLIAGWWSGCGRSVFGMVIIASRLQQLHDRKSRFRRSLPMRLRAVHSRYAVVSQTPHVGLLWLSQQLPFPHLQHRI